MSKPIVWLSKLPKLHAFKHLHFNDVGFKDNSWSSFWITEDGGCLAISPADDEGDIQVEDLGPATLSVICEGYNKCLN